MFFLSYWIRRLWWRAAYFVFHCFALINYGIKGEVVPPVSNPILLKPAVVLAEEIRHGKLKSEEVIKAYIDRIKEVNSYVNAVAEPRFTEAIEEAKVVDILIQSGDYSEEELKKEKPLLGVPFTVKTLLNVKGLRSTAGCKLFEHVFATEDAACVELLKNSGAIVISTSNAPEFGVSTETNNEIYGKTCNPYDTSKTSGGSSGGESALIAAAASIIGLGNDLGGSLRIPAHCTGIFSHKATVGLIPSNGSCVRIHPSISDFVYSGPMCRYSCDLITLTKILSADNLKSLDFKSKIHFNGLKIYYCTTVKDTASIPVDKHITEAIKKAASYFKENHGAEVREIEIPQMNENNNIIWHKIQYHVENLTEFLTWGQVSRVSLIPELFKYFIGKSKFSFYFIWITSFHRSRFYYNKNKVSYYEKCFEDLRETLDQLLDETSLLFMPSFPTTAPYHYEMLPLCFNLHFTNIFNRLGLPVTNCPLGLNPNGLPQGMQIVGKMHNDALTLACAEELEKVFGGWIPPFSS